MIPKVLFKINPEEDLRVLSGFISDAAYDGGRNLDWAVYTRMPELRDLIKAKQSADIQREAGRSIAAFFELNSRQIQENILLYEQNWRKVEAAYELLVDDLFSKRAWPQGEYVAFATMWGMFPRDLKRKTFQVPAIYENSPYVNVIIAHELLHFMFYDLYYEMHPEDNKPEQNFFVWKVSEIFNEVVQNSPTWKNVFGLETMGYPEFEKIIHDIKNNAGHIKAEELVEEIRSLVKKSEAT